MVKKTERKERITLPSSMRMRADSRRLSSVWFPAASMVRKGKEWARHMKMSAAMENPVARESERGRF